jgi:hypothetical protein
LGSLAFLTVTGLPGIPYNIKQIVQVCFRHKNTDGVYDQLISAQGIRSIEDFEKSAVIISVYEFHNRYNFW